MKKLTKEEFLDKGNLDLIREMKDIFELKAQVEQVRKYVNDLERESDIPSCMLHARPVDGMPRVGYSVLQLAMNLAKAYFENRLVLKESSCTEGYYETAKLWDEITGEAEKALDIIDKDALKKKSASSSCTETNLGKAKLYFRDEHGNWYDNEGNLKGTLGTE